MGTHVNSFHNSNSGTATTIAATDTGNTTTGNLLRVSCGWGTTDRTPTCADIANGNYTEIGTHTWDSGNNQGMAQFYFKNITSAILPVITVTFPGNVTDLHIQCTEISGLDTSAPLDQSASQVNTAPGTGTDGATSGNMSATTNASDFIISSFQDITGTSYTVTEGTSYTARDTWTTASGQPIKLETRQVSATGTYAGTFTLSADKRCIVNVVAFKDAAAGGTRPVKMAGLWGGYAGESGGFAG